MFRRMNASIFNKVINQKLIVLDFTYKLESEVFRMQLSESRLRHLKKYFDQEIFLTVGSKLNKQGEVFIVSGAAEASLDKILQEDPYNHQKIGSYKVIKFGPTLCEQDFGINTFANEKPSPSELLILSLNYHTPLDETLKKVDQPEIQGAHVDFLKKHYGFGLFKISGRKQPRTGGVIISENMSDQALQEVLSEDSFNINKLTDYDLIRFAPGLIK